MNVMKDVSDINPSLSRGFNRKYPLAFMDSMRCIKFQTNKISSDGTPRYCVDGSKKTYHIAAIKHSEGIIPIWYDEDRELLWDLQELSII